ncbi:MAG: HEAT repeat domain-containing protein [Bacteroidales bacterium]|nr:HEAT repeat domain-containing protein [Bacteroidales bacterium]
MDKLKQNKLIINKLQSNDIEEVLFALKELRNTGNKNLIPVVIELLSKHKNERVKKSITELLYDLKYQAAAPYIVEAIKSDNYKEIRAQLLSVCWQSRLDFSEYIPVFIEQFIKGSFSVAFEAFTAIDSMDAKIEENLALESIKKLKNELSSIAENKKELLVELVHILENKETK